MPTLVSDVNSNDKIRLMACGPYFSVCYSEFGLIYAWGLSILDDVSSIIWDPCFISMSTTIEMTEIEQLSFQIVDIKVNSRELLACDGQGRVYNCDLSSGTLTLKLYPAIKNVH